MTKKRTHWRVEPQVRGDAAAKLQLTIDPRSD